MLMPIQQLRVLPNYNDNYQLKQLCISACQQSKPMLCMTLLSTASDLLACLSDCCLRHCSLVTQGTELSMHSSSGGLGGLQVLTQLVLQALLVCCKGDYLLLSPCAQSS